MNDEMNVFLRSKKVLQVENQLVTNPDGAMWSFCIRYLDDITAGDSREKVDYLKVLDGPTFARFSALRDIRRTVAKEEGVPAFTIFTDAELAEMAKEEVLTASSMKAIKGIGEKKMEKYSPRFLTKPTDAPPK